jgi:serine protease
MIMPIRVLGVDGGTYSDIANGIRYAARRTNSSGTLPAARANVINMSLGGPGLSSTLQDACTAARNAGVLIIAAAGNESSDGDYSPAGLTGVVSVSSVDPFRDLAYYSNFGPKVDIAAPGGDATADRNGDGNPDGVLSTLALDSGAYVYEWYQGTSMAAPHVAGVAALMYAVNPGLTPAQAESILSSSAEDIGLPGFDDSFGAGLVNAYRAVLAAQGGTGAPPALSISPTSVDLGTSQTTVDVYVTNSGGGTLTVNTPTTSTQDGAGWLSASRFGAGDSTRSHNGVRITVNRAGRPAGSYFGRVTVTSNGGSEDVEVIFTVLSGAPTPINLDVYVLAVDPDTDQTVDQVVVNPQTGLDFHFPALPVGTYYLYAGTDLDDDDFICDEGEWCGAWPVQGDARLVTVTRNADTGGIEFNLVPDTGISSAAAAARCTGIRRLR